MNYYEKKGDFLKFLRKTMRIMRLSLFLIVISTAMAFSANSYSQNTKLTLDLDNATVKEVIKAIENQSEFLFFYQEKHVDLNRKVTLHANEQDVETILDQIFAGTDNIYVINDRQIVIGIAPRRELEKQMLSLKGNVKTVTGQPQEKEITGKVTDSEGLPLPGVSVIVKGTTIGTVTNNDGEFSLNVPLDAEILQFSFVGMKTQEIPVEYKTTFTVVMEEDVIGIEEVVAVGYGTIKRSDLTGSISSIKGEDLIRSPIVSLEQGLQGQTAGVEVFQSSGQPGSASRIRIRGTNSINGGSQPLYVIDGFPFYNSSVNSGILASSGGLSPLSNINPSDIESIEVLKDASATAIYGSRASNGVIIITTKKGKIKKSQISLNAYYGIQSVSRKIDLLNAQEYAIFQNEAFELRDKETNYTQADIDYYGLHGGTDWQDEIFTTSPIQNYILTMNGGDENTNYYISGGYLSQEGIIINSGYERASFRINLQQKIKDKLSVGTNFSYSQSNSALTLTNTTGSANGGVVFRALNEDPTKPVYTEDGEFNYAKHGLFWGGNAVADAMLIENNTIVDRMIGNFSAKWQITPEITGTGLFGLDIINSEDRFFQPAELFRSSGRNFARLGKVKSFTWLNDYTLTYHKLFNTIHNLTFVIGSSMQANNYNRLIGSTQDLIIEELKYYSLSGGTNPSNPNSYFSDWSFASFFSRANYIFDDKYLFTITGRYDGTSRFAKGNKWGFFPSGSFAWRLSEENFIKTLNVFSNLKARTSFGVTGNSEIGLYNTQQILGQTYYSFGDEVVVGYGPSSYNLPNPGLGWESTSQFDIGLDIGVMENKISANIDFYSKITTDLLFNSTVPLSSGRSVSQKNLGKIENKGFEFNLNTINIRKSNFEWTTSFNISHNENKVIDLGGVDMILFGSASGGAWVMNYDPSALIVGEPIGIFYGYMNDGIVQMGEEESVPKVQGLPDPFPGWHNYKDMDGDNLITSDDRTVIGNPYPDFTGGITNSLSYRGFDLSLILTGAVGYDIFSFAKSEMMLGRGERNIHKDFFYNFWTENNPTNDYTKNGLKDTQSILFSRNPMSYWVEHVSFLRIQNITLAYNLPRDFLNRMKLTSAKIYISGDNLHCFTNYVYGYDPEVSKFGNSNIRVGQDQDTYPRAKSVLFGVNISF